MAELKGWTHAALTNIDRSDRITFPTEIDEGDLVVIGAIHYKGPRLPAGYVSVQSSTQSAGRSVMGWKVATSSDAAALDYQFVTIPAYNPLVPSTIVTGGGGWFVMTFAAGTFDPSDPILHLEASSTENGIGGWEVPAYEQSYFWTFLDYIRFAGGPDVWSTPTVPHLYPDGYVLDSIVTAGIDLTGPPSNPYVPAGVVDPDSQSILAIATSDQVTGHYMASVASNAPNAWGFRAGFSVRPLPGATTWGPMSGEPPITPVPYLFPAAEAITANVGIENALVSTGTGDASSNVGVQPTPADTAVGVSTSSVGIASTPVAASTAYATTSDINIDTRPSPHIWTTHRRGGLVGDIVTIYGHGFYAGYVDDTPFEPIPVGGYEKYYEIGYGRGVSSTPGVRYLLGSGGELVVPQEDMSTFGDPSEFHIDPDGGVGPVFVNLEHTKLEVIIPAEAAVDPGSGPGPFTDYFVINDTGSALEGHESNKAPFRLYPLIPTTMANSPTANRGATLVRVIAEPTDVTRIDQTHDKILLSGRMISNGYAERMPLFAAFSTSGADLGEVNASEYVLEPRDNTTVMPGNGGTWIPTEDTIVAHPELGTGVSLWEPYFGATAQRWRMIAPNAPYLDPTFVTEPGNINRDPIIRPALVFTGDQQLQLVTPIPVPTEPEEPQQFTISMAFMMNARGGTIMQTESIGPSSGQPDVKLVDSGTLDVIFPDYSVAAQGQGGAEGDLQILAISVRGNMVEYCWGGYSLDSRTFFNPEAGIPFEELSITLGGPVAGVPANEMTRMNLFEVSVLESFVSTATLRQMVAGMYARYRRIYF